MSEYDDDFYDDDDDGELAREALIEAVQNQIEAGDPPAAKATFNKLTLVGYERQDILTLMGQVLAVEVYNMMTEKRAFNLEWYESALRALPELPAELSQGDDE
ncbi:hypothetical protein LG197_05945 [Pseudomonas asiatica]|uniref:Uncharacterized protein n=1 Tax=Pseudomonas monteilii SB3101 TaxID=1435058 RepID=V9V900_9PSED|nr:MULTISPECIES: hypothetical protein [Pseudomonas]AEJ10745.1 conserved hypothetical protein [Pseudomonas putida S16]AHC85475.1 hypothetical protein X969_27020 [Pseudomonas monteilii SB3078]AHC90843.1 hypothetical protein X970_26635 [Pseudomonas monteilii SB3101]KAF4558327.1 hypothetical protein HBJ16_004113 [Pseudomonas sp. CES]MBF8802691.1 hypothetical protein [Pseudomonas asiatica]